MRCSFRRSQTQNGKRSSVRLNRYFSLFSPHPSTQPIKFHYHSCIHDAKYGTFLLILTRLSEPFLKRIHEYGQGGDGKDASFTCTGSGDSPNGTGAFLPRRGQECPRSFAGRRRRAAWFPAPAFPRPFPPPSPPSGDSHPSLKEKAAGKSNGLLKVAEREGLYGFHPHALHACLASRQTPSGDSHPSLKEKAAGNIQRPFKSGGERGIRTPGGLHLSGFQDRRLKPLDHLSVLKSAQCINSAQFNASSILHRDSALRFSHPFPPVEPRSRNAFWFEGGHREW